MTAHVLFFLFAVGAGVVTAYKHNSFLFEKVINFWLILATSGVLTIFGIIVKLVDKSFIGDVLFYAGIAVASYLVISTYIFDFDSEEESQQDSEQSADALDLDERIQALKEKNRQ